MNIKSFVSALFIISVTHIHAQDAARVRPLKEGEYVGHLVFHHMVNYPGSTARISDFKGKLVILDFWNRYCTSCMAAIPKMEEVQKEFDGRIQILMVNCLNPLSELKGFPSSSPSPNLRNTGLPLAIGDTGLCLLFPHSFEPYEVIITPDGRIGKFTQAHNITVEHVQQLLDGQKINVATVHNMDDVIGRNEPLLRSKVGEILDSVRGHSILLANLFMGSMSGPLSNSSGHVIGFQYIDGPLFGLYKCAYDFWRSNDRIIVECKDPERFYAPLDPNAMDQWAVKNVFCYELSLPSSPSSDNIEAFKKIAKIMRQDLDRYFGVTGSVEKRRVKCLALVRDKTRDSLTISKSQPHLEPIGSKGYFAYNFPLSDFCSDLSNANRTGYSLPIVVDQTGYSRGVDLEIESSLNDLPAVQKELAKYGLGLVEKEEELELLILKDSK